MTIVVFQTGDVVHNKLTITEYSSIEVLAVNGKITIIGGLEIISGKTLHILAENIVFAPSASGAPAVVKVGDGATLVLGTKAITVGQGVRFDSDGGIVVFRGAPDAVNQSTPNAAPLAFEPSAAALQSWLSWMAQDRNYDFGLRSLILGDARALTRVPSTLPWTGFTVDSVTLRGSNVHLGSVGEPDWAFRDAKFILADAGSLVLNVNLQVDSNIALAATQGQVSMSPNVQISAKEVIICAASGVTINKITATSRLDLYSPAGSIVATQGYPTAHITTHYFSMYGYGQLLNSADQARVLKVESKNMQVSAPAGVASRGFANADGGLMYRLMNNGVGYIQFHIVGASPLRVMVASQQIDDEMHLIRQGKMPTLWQEPDGVLPAAGSASGNFGFEVFNSKRKKIYSSSSIAWNQVDMFLANANSSVNKSYPYLRGRILRATQMFINPPPPDKEALAHNIAIQGTNISVSGGNQDAYVMVVMQ